MPRLPLAIAILVIPATGLAQERLELVAIPDLSIFDASLPNGERWTKTDRVTNLTLSIGGGFGTASDMSGSGAVGAAVLGLGSRRAHWLLQLRSEVSGPIADDRGGDAARELRGRHRARAIYRLRDDRGPGATLELDARARHAGEQGFRLAPLRLGRAPVVAGSLAVGGRLEPWSDFGDSVFYVPVRYTAERIRWRSGAPVTEAKSDGLTMGVGFGPEEREGIAGGIDFIRGTVRHTEISRSPATAAAANGSARADTAAIREVALSTGIDELIMYDRKVLMSVTARYGWTWLETDVPGLEDSMFTMNTAMHLRRGKTPDRSGRVGFGIARVPGHTADGSVLTADWRLELSVDQQSDRLGLSARGALSWVTPVDGGEPGADTLLRYGSHVEAFYKLPADLQLGVYHAASFEPHGVADPWSSPRTWSTEAGLLLRYRRLPGRARSHRRGGRPIELAAQ